MQYKIDVIRFTELLSKFTGISKSKIENYLKNYSIKNIFEHSTSFEMTSEQRNKLEGLKELRNIYKSVKQHEKEYVIDSSSKAGEYFVALFEEKKDKEYFICAFLDSGNKILATEIMNTGTINEAHVYPREIAKKAILHDANGIIISHNHPGGSGKASNADVCVTNEICKMTETLNIKMMDHIIVYNSNYMSFADAGLLNNYAISNVGVKENVNFEDYDINKSVRTNTVIFTYDEKTLRADLSLKSETIMSLQRTFGLSSVDAERLFDKACKYGIEESQIAAQKKPIASLESNQQKKSKNPYRDNGR